MKIQPAVDRPVLGVIFVALLFAGCGEKQAAQGGASGAGAPSALAAIVLSPSVSASAGSTVPGNVLAEQQIDVQAEIAGKVAHIGFREGESVSAGQLLLRLDDAELKARFEQAEASRMLARTREQRVLRDFKAHAVSRAERDQAVAEAANARAAAALAKAQWEKTRIRAPFAGMIGLREVELGSVVQPGTRLATLQNLGSLRVEFSVPERNAAAMRPGLSVRFTTASSPDTFTAAVYAVEPRIDTDTRQLRVRARTKQGGVLPGAFARVELPVRTTPALWLPTLAVVQSAEGAQVWVVREGRAQLTPFTPGERGSRTVEALEGLSAGDTVLVSGLMQLRVGVPVRPEVAADASLPAPAP